LVLTHQRGRPQGFEKLQAAGLQAVDVAVLIDRESGGRELLERRGYRLHAVFGFRELLRYWHAAGHVDAAMMAQVEAFLVQSLPVPSA
jgi:uridine monophosphate synthetase